MCHQEKSGGAGLLNRAEERTENGCHRTAALGVARAAGLSDKQVFAQKIVVANHAGLDTGCAGIACGFR